MKSPIILALDTKEIDTAEKWILAASEHIDHFKIGLEFYLRHGSDGIERLQQQAEFELFLDLKLYDIPNTVKAAVESVARLKPKFLTVHASGGSAMISAAKSALPNGSITAVTVLTSFSEAEFTSLGFTQTIDQVATSWAKMAVSAGATSIVCSPFEVSSLRDVLPKTILITPGVRDVGDDHGDQVRVMTAQDAIKAGSDFVVIGRSITNLWDGSDTAMRTKIEQIRSSIN